MPCAPGPRNPGQFCSGLEALYLEAKATEGSAIKELARNERRDNSIDFPCVSSFISFICSPFSNLCSRYYITGELRNQSALRQEGHVYRIRGGEGLALRQEGHV